MFVLLYCLYMLMWAVSASSGEWLSPIPSCTMKCIVCVNSVKHCDVVNYKYYTLVFFLIFLLILLIFIKFLKFIRKQFLKRKYLSLCLKKWRLHQQEVYQRFVPVARNAFFATFCLWHICVLIKNVSHISNFFNIKHALMSVCLQCGLWPVLSW